IYFIMKFFVASIFLFLSGFLCYSADFSIGPLDYEIVSIKDRIAKPIRLNQNIETLEIPFIVEYNGLSFSIPTVSRINGTYISNVRDVVVGEGITKLEDSFLGFSGMETISFPETLRILGASNTYSKGTFEGCSSLKEIIIPQSVDSICGPLFKDCTSLSKIEFKGNPLFEYKSNVNNYIYATDGVFQNCTSLESISLPQNLKVIGNRFFSGCTNLKEVNLPSSCSAICDYAFQDCISLQYFSFPKRLIGIGYSAFNNSGLVGNIQLPDDIRLIENDAFRDCKGITSITFPNNCCLEVGSYVLYGCSNLEQITIPSNGGIFNGVISDSPSLKTVNSLTINPPTVTKDFFSNSILLQATLNITESARSQYDSSEWGNFLRITEKFENPGMSTLYFILNVPDTYKALYKIYYPEDEIQVPNGNSVKIDLSYTSLGYGQTNDDYKQFVPWFNSYPISLSSTIHSISNFLNVIEKPDDIFGGNRFYLYLINI
ncbi:MAG: leucine-rich repeat domain-containing protein, partial [Clostridia bacterium]|nr:leucine-rich repeat domain-containing protein [Clostridia bacterium]